MDVNELLSAICRTMVQAGVSVLELLRRINVFVYCCEILCCTSSIEQIITEKCQGIVCFKSVLLRSELNPFCVLTDRLMSN